jgi:hypothetical protein
MAKLTKKTWMKPNTSRSIPNWKKWAKERALARAKWRAQA